MPIDIDQLTEAELIALNHRIVARLRFLQELRAHSSMLEFRIGERVRFHPDGRPAVTGIVTRYNKKTVSILTGDGQRWTVSPQTPRASRYRCPRRGAGQQQRDSPAATRQAFPMNSRAPPQNSA